jgi:hypothetical protein
MIILAMIWLTINARGLEELILLMRAWVSVSRDAQTATATPTLSVHLTMNVSKVIVEHVALMTQAHRMV